MTHVAIGHDDPLRAGHALLDRAAEISQPPTPTARALVGCLALADGHALNYALELSGYSTRLASPVSFFQGRCYQGGWRRVIVRRGRVVRVGLALDNSMWMLRLGRKLAALRGVSVPSLARVA